MSVDGHGVSLYIQRLASLNCELENARNINFRCGFQRNAATIFITKCDTDEPVTVIMKLSQDAVKKLKLGRMWDDAR